ncbi:MAG: sulfurtransferase complex subunit TusB [Promethearchaeota archaeon]
MYGFSTTLESKLVNLLRLLEYQLEQKKKIHVVFIHDGVIGTSKKSKASNSLLKLLKLPIFLYSMKPDLLARGIDAQNLQDGIRGIDYDDLVDLLVTTPKIVSWM